MRFIPRLMVPLVTVLMLLLPSGAAVSAATYPLSSSDTEISEALDYLRGLQAPDGSVGGFADSGWVCIAVGAAGEDPNTWVNGGPSLVDYLKLGPSDVTGEFNMGTFLSRMVLAAVAAGENPSAFGSWSGSNAGVDIVDGDYLTALLSLHDGTQFLQDLNPDPDSAETLNEDFWAVRALIAAGLSPSSSVVQSTAQHIVNWQEADGGWTWGTPNHSWYSPGFTDVDNTAAAIVALCLAGHEGSAAVQDGLDFMRLYHDDSGGFVSTWFGVNVQTTAWAVDAIGASGDDPTGSSWIPLSSSPVDYLLAAQHADGSFDGMLRSTCDAVMALVGGFSLKARQASTAVAPVAVGGEAFPSDKAGLLLLPLVATGSVALAVILLRRRFAAFTRTKP